MTVDGERVGSIGAGLVVLLGITHGDSVRDARSLAEKVFRLRILRDDQSLATAAASALVISQFTLYADTRRGRRPSWNAAAPAEIAEPLYEAFCAHLATRQLPSSSPHRCAYSSPGVALAQIHLTNNLRTK